MDTFNRLHEDNIKNGPKCYCGYRKWDYNGKIWICSNCKRELFTDYPEGYIRNGPKCSCGYRDWLIGERNVVCTNCGKTLRVRSIGYEKKGNKCTKCSYRRGWFIEERGAICSQCGNLQSSANRIINM